MVDFGLAAFALRDRFRLQIKQKSLYARTKSGEGRGTRGRSSHQWSSCAMGDSSVAGMLYMVELLGADAFGSRINSIFVANRFVCNFDFGDCRGCDLFRWRMSSTLQSVSRRWPVGKSWSVGWICRGRSGVDPGGAGVGLGDDESDRVGLNGAQWLGSCQTSGTERRGRTSN